jgi:hypothetical protein
MNNLYQQFKPVMFSERLFVSPLFDERAARVIHRYITGKDSSLVSRQDPRLLRYRSSAAEAAAREALDRFDIIHKDDFTGLGIAEKMIDKIINNLIFRGYIDFEGRILEAVFPSKEADFKISTDFSAHQEAVFDIIHQIYLEELPPDSESPDAMLDYAVYESDLSGLDLPALQTGELYNNLIFNGYLDEDGNVLTTALFADPENYSRLSLNTAIDTYGAIIYQLITGRMSRFENEVLYLKRDVFDALSLAEIEIDDLFENLKFNGYLNRNGAFVNKNAILSAGTKDFNLALQYYPYRHKILNALKTVISEFKSHFYVLSREDFSNVAETIVSQMVYDYVSGAYCHNGRLKAEKRAFFKNSDNLSEFQPGNYFDAAAREAVFNAVGRFLASAENYQLTDTDLEDLGLYTEDRSSIATFLTLQQFINDRGMIVDGKLTYFLNINNALLFDTDEFQDYNKDLFFVLHDLAKETEKSIKEISEKLKDLAGQQEAVLFTALQEIYELPADIVRVICRHVFLSSDNMVEEWILPLLAAVDKDDRIAEEPKNNKLNYAYRRIGQFAHLATKLRLDKNETDVVFRDQSLEEKYPEKLTLPENIAGFDALLEMKVDGSSIKGSNTKGMIDLIYIFSGNKYWVYAAENYNLLISGAPLSSLFNKFSELTKIDAAFTDEEGAAWIISGNRYFCKTKDSEKWETKEKTLGEVKNNFSDPKQIDASFVDSEGKTYLFAGDQYARYTGGQDTVDEGFPKKIKGNWPGELDFNLPDDFCQSIDASFQSPDEKTYIFRGTKFVSSEDSMQELEIREFWGKINNNFDGAKKIDAAFVHGHRVYLFAGDQMLSYSNSIENDGVLTDEGSLQSLKQLPEKFRSGISAEFRGFDGKTYLFKEKSYISAADDGSFGSESPVKDRWGKVRNSILASGTVNAAFTGLDGRTYLFSSDQYYRYSGNRYSHVDEGYPRSIKSDWAGLEQVDAAFILDGKTYLFGKYRDTENSGELKIGYVRYSSSDYRVHDQGYPKPPDDNWWNLPDQLIKSGFSTPDCVFIGQEGESYLFSGNQFIVFDARHRWWSEPQSLPEKWDSIPFAKVDAAFTGKDGKTYLFSGTKYIRYSDKTYSKIDDRFPKVIKSDWGKVINNIDKTGAIDAALIVVSREKIDESEEVKETKDTYLFSGDQFFRYSTDATYDWAANGYPEWVDDGYPKSIKSALKNEPRFRNLKTVFDNGIDAAFADRRNVYLFKDSQCYVVSETLYREYPNLLDEPAGCVFLDDGTLYMETGQEWQQFSSLEGRTLNKTGTLPPILREVPTPFKSGLDAVLNGVDQNTYLFKDGQCFNTLLNKSYPLNEEWGKVKNNIIINNRIDAAFVGLDGKTYLFSGDQFVSYTPASETSKEIPSFVDGNPQPIQEHWGGLTQVDLAFVKDSKTYLFEKPGPDGRFRYLCYSTKDYTEPDPGFPKTADISWWKIPDMYLQEGFDNVDAVLFDDDNMFLVNGKSFIQFNQIEDLWTYPRPLERIWRGIPVNDDNFSAIISAFKGSDGRIYFFSDEAFVSYENNAFSTIKDIKSRWGVINNHIVQRNHIDAAFVHHTGNTYLFSGDQYVRYSTVDYRYVDDGYPKLIIKNLRQEPGFTYIPDVFITRMETLIAGGVTLDGIFGNQRNIYIFENRNCHVFSRELTGSYEISRFGKFKNNIAQDNKVDAAFVTDSGQAILFSGDQYIRYSGSDYQYVDEGYPKALAANGEGLPPWLRVDAVFRGKNNVTYFFRDRKYAEVADASSGFNELDIKDRWGKIRNNFQGNGSGHGTNIPIDAAFLAPGGGFYVFKGDQYIRYSHSGNEYIDEGFPKQIKDNWGNLPVNYEASVNGGFVFDGKTYLLKRIPVGGGEAVLYEYVRYSDPSYAAIDAIYPQKFSHRWGQWNDYLLTDIHTISRYKRLQEEYSSDEHRLTDFFNDEKGYKKEPYKMLSEIFGWDTDDLKWLKRKNAFLYPENLFEVEFNLELILKIFDVFTVTNKMGTTPRELYEEVWLPIYEAGDLEKAGGLLYKFLGLINTEKDWQVLSRQLHNELNTIKRDALMPFVIFKKGLDNSRDLYELLLIDAEMTSCAESSRIKEAITAVQLYLHRFFVNLEQIEISGELDDVKRRQLKRWWQWMKNYRVWEANRKVFLYPENYIRPELRDSKTPAFKTLEEDLLQGEINDAAVARAYKKYLDHYTEVSRLKIAGGYVYDDASSAYEKQLILFGRTKTDPRQYFYRSAAFIGGDTNAVQWEPWQEVNIQIDAKKVYPVFAFGRVFVFWAQVETEMPDTSSAKLTTTESDGVQTVSGESTAEYVLRIYFSFYNLNKEWVPPQSLDTQINPDGTGGGNNGENQAVRALQMRSSRPITSFKLFVENSEKLENHTHENIVINCSYNVDGQAKNSAFILTPELYSKLTLKPTFINAGIDVFRSLFDSREVITESRVVFLNTYENSTDGPWYSFDHKGGSFLVKPAVPGLTQENIIQELSASFPAWDRIDASVQGPDGSRYFFKNDTGKYVSSADLKKELNTADRWGIKQNTVYTDEQVDAAFFDDANNKTYLFRQDQYIAYSGRLYEYALDDYPRSIKNNTEGFPKWEQIDAAFKAGDQQVYFFKNDSQEFVSSKDVNKTFKTTDRWGKIKNSFTDPKSSQVSGSFVVGNDTYLANGEVFIKYSNDLYNFIDKGYPKSGGVKALLEDLGFRNVAGKYAKAIDGAYVHKNDLFIHSHRNFTIKCSLKDKKITDLNNNTDSFEAGYVNGKGKVQVLKRQEYGAAFVSGTTFYLFKSDEYMRMNSVPDSFAQVNWKASGKISQAWGREKNNLSQNGVVDAAFQDGRKTFLFSGNEYYVYTADNKGKIGDFVDAGYPKKLSTNSEKLPKWTELSAAFRSGDGKTYFFNNTTQKYVVSGALSTAKDIKGRWGIIRNNVVEKGVDAAYMDGTRVYLISGNEYVRYSADESGGIPQFVDDGYPKTIPLPTPPKFNRVNAAFTYQGNLYLISGDLFIRCPESNPYAIHAGYPKPGRLGDILRDLGFKNVPGRYTNLQVHGTYTSGTDLFVHSHGYTLKCALASQQIIPLNNNTEYFEAAYFNNRNELQKLKNESYDAAVVVDKVFYLFKGDAFMKSDQIPDSFGEDLTWAPTGKIRDKWSIDSAAFELGGYIYLFFQDTYFRLNIGAEPESAIQNKPINGNWGNIPAEFKSGFDAALKAVEFPDKKRVEKFYLIKEKKFIEYFLEEGKARPYEIESAEFDIIRLTTGTGYKLNQKLFAGGIGNLLSLPTQEIDEIPQFSTEVSGPSTIKYVEAKVNKLPISSHLDFFSANGLYYWEIFFHAPFLIAQSFNTDQKFDESKRWYEFIYDPTEKQNYWTFLPFLTVDIEALIGSGSDAIKELEKLKVDMGDVRAILDPIFKDLQPFIEVFLGHREITPAEKDYLDSKDEKDLKGTLKTARQKLQSSNGSAGNQRIEYLKSNLIELTQIIEMLWYRYQLMQTSDEQIQVYQDDPFDPHAIAGLRRIAYRKAIVMAYIDNLIDWGDMLFRQYTVESISEARMLYILAYDLLGRRPESLSTKVLPETRAYSGPGAADGLYNPSKAYEFLLDLENATQPLSTKLSFTATIHDSIVNNTYFFIPENELFVDYWDRVEDRLHKIRHCLNILGVKQPLPLFQPPIDPLAIVQAVGAGAGLAEALAGADVPVPHYRFTFMVNKAKELVQKLNQFGGELLSALEKQDAEELSLMQNKQEGVILGMMEAVRAAQLGEVEATISSLQESKKNAQERIQHFQRLISTGMNSYEQTQMSLMIAGAAAQYASVVLKILGGIMYVIPEATAGLFSFGVKTGGIHAGSALNSAAEGAQTLGEALSMTGEAIGVQAAFERMKDEWVLQKLISESEVRQIDAQIRGAEWQKKAAQREIEILEKEIEQNESIKVFMKEKFTNRQLYQWMTGKLSGIFYQTYKLAHDMAKYAEKAFRFERGVPENEVNVIQPMYWDSQKKGLLAGDSLGLDVDRMEQAFIESNRRRLEISRNISLLELDPLALLQLKTRGECEFRLPESFFDYDYQGHYCRQIKTISLTFDMADGEQVLATLTQLGNHTVLEPDPKAVKFLLNPTDDPPLSIRSDWRANQQIALSHIEEYEKNNGLFELRFDDERYLPFEGTGAVSSWRLTLNGKKGSYNIKQLTNVIINLKYTALQGGEAFASAVKGLLKPYRTAIFFDLAGEFPNEWNEFISNGADLKVTFTREMFPNMSSSKISGIFSQFDRAEDGALSLVLNGDEELTLKNNQFLDTSGLSIGSQGSEWTFTLKGNKEILNTVNLVITYKASVS